MERLDTGSLDIEGLARQCFPGWKTSILKEISGGQSGAAVLLVDLAVDHASGGIPSELQPGQYILKVQAQNPWPGEAQESRRHSEASKRNDAFGREHIPELRRAETIEGKLLLLYEVAGQSLSSFVAADTVDAAALRHYCSLAATDLWSPWNDTYTVNIATSAAASLRAWLGYRLNPGEATQLHAFVAAECDGRAIFRMADRVLVNPLFAATSEHLDVPVASVSFGGMIHGDLHLGNILVDRTLKRRDQYWLIDFALAKEAPLGFDQAYLELSLLIGLLKGVEPQRILNILEALDSADDPGYSSRVPVSDVGILDSCSVIRHANSRWHASKEPKRTDSVHAQCLLSRIAVGLNWANKPLSDSRRRLGLAYAAWAATRYFELFNRVELETLFTAQRQVQRLAISPVTPTWPDVWEQLGRFDDAKAKYVLIADRLDVSNELRSLALVPWSVIVDLDPFSNENGLHSAIGLALAAQRSLNQFGMDAIPIDADRGTAWFMANGWPSRHESVPGDFRRWRSDYGERYRKLLRDLRRAAAPLPVKVVILASDQLDRRLLESIVAMADESLETSSDITVIGFGSLGEDPAVKAHYSLAVPEFIKAVNQVFGASVQMDEPTVPGSDGPVSVGLAQLRSLEEDLHILHSNLLVQSPSGDDATDAFWKGNPPTWSDLHAHVDVPRSIGPRLLKKISGLLHARGNYTVELNHSPGSGGTTAALRCAWDLRRDFPVSVLRQYSSTTADRIDQLFRLSQKPVLLIAEAAVLPPANREDLFREIAKRNVRCVLLYVIRTFRDDGAAAMSGEPLTDRLEITDPITDDEAQAFLTAFSARTTDPGRRRLLVQLATTERWKPYRNPFFFGLTTYEEEFESVHSYVEHHLSGISTDTIKKLVRFLALVTKYSQTGISIGLFNHFLGLDPASDVDIKDAVGDVVDRLIVRRGQVVRLLHPVIAQEVLRQLIGGNDWKYGLRDLCLEFIAETAGTLGADADETSHLFSELFIRRDYWTPSARRRRNFSELILDIPVPAGQHQVLLTLTETCSDEPHFWNHLGRHHIYEMKQDFAEAERHLHKAVELSPEEKVHHHSLGMVRRFWIRSLMADMLRGDTLPSAEELFQAIHELFVGAAKEFALSRELAPEDNHGYITHIQLILEVLETLVRIDAGKTLPALLGQANTIGDWARASVVVAEDLLRQVRHLRELDAPSRYELFCTNGLAALYGHFDAVISSLETLLKSAQDPDVRRALATAYFSKSGRVWSRLPPVELRRTKDLMEDNLRSDPTNERDIRSWFQAFRRLPEFSYIDAIDRLEAWAKRANQVDAFYYLYILHFLRWRQGSERDESAMRASLDQCRQRSIGKRGLSYEWLAKEPSWCPLAHASELGEWDEFFTNTEPLDWVTGSIATIRPQAGTIRLGPQTVAYFVPGTRFSETRHLNSLVRCYIGFSYEGLRAWSVEFLTEDTATIGDLVQTKALIESSLQGEDVGAQVAGRSAREDALDGVADVDTLARTVERFVQDQLATSINRNKPLYVSAIGNQLLDKFGRPPVYERLRFKKLEDLLLSIPSINLLGEGATAVVMRPGFRDRGVQKEREVSRAPVRPGDRTHAPAQDLREEVLKEVLQLLTTSPRPTPSLSLAFLGNRLVKRFGAPLVYRRLGFGTLRELVESYEELELDQNGDVVLSRH